MKLDPNAKLSALAQFAIKQELATVFGKIGLYNKAVQGELTGKRINGGRYKRPDLEFWIYDIYDIEAKKRIPPEEVRTWAETLKGHALCVNHVPVLETNFALDMPAEEITESLLKKADGQSQLAAIPREGLVFKSNTDWEVHFKVISNEFLLNY